MQHKLYKTNHKTYSNAYSPYFPPNKAGLANKSITSAPYRTALTQPLNNDLNFKAL